MIAVLSDESIRQIARDAKVDYAKLSKYVTLYGWPILKAVTTIREQERDAARNKARDQRNKRKALDREMAERRKAKKAAKTHRKTAGVGTFAIIGRVS